MSMRSEIDDPTWLLSLEANLSTGMMNKKKKSERIAKPLAVRDYDLKVISYSTSTRGITKRLTTTPWSQAKTASS